MYTCDCISITIGGQTFSANVTATVVNGRHTFAFEFSPGVTYTIEYATQVDNTKQWTLLSNTGAVIAIFIGNRDCPIALQWTNQNVSTTECVDYCEPDTGDYYRLVDCAGLYLDIFSKDPALEAAVGNIIRIPFFKNSCFSVYPANFSKFEKYYPPINFAGPYDDCLTCAPKEPVHPVVITGDCDPEIVEEIKCSFVDMVYQQMMSKRLGIEFCCPADKVKWDIKNDILDQDLIVQANPPLPEPVVEVCCIPTTPTCLPTPCCNQVVLPTSEVCHCEASQNSPHDCHTYQVTVTSLHIAAAVGNTATHLNGKVFFGYFKCKETAPTILSYTAPNDESFCVIGIPRFGYYRNDVWTEITLVRGAVCVDPITPCCHV